MLKNIDNVKSYFRKYCVPIFIYIISLLFYSLFYVKNIKKLNNELLRLESNNYSVFKLIGYKNYSSIKYLIISIFIILLLIGIIIYVVKNKLYFNESTKIINTVHSFIIIITAIILIFNTITLITIPILKIICIGTLILVGVVVSFINS